MTTHCNPESGTDNAGDGFLKAQAADAAHDWEETDDDWGETDGGGDVVKELESRLVGLGKTIARVATMASRRASKRASKGAPLAALSELSEPWHKRTVVVHAAFDDARPYRVHFDWHPGYKGWASGGLGCDIVLYDRGGSRPRKVQQQPDEAARVAAVQDMWGSGSAGRGDWLAAFARAGPGPEKAGHVYVYARECDMRQRREGALAHVLLHKVGMTRRSPQQRIADQEEANGESYSLVLAVPTKYPQFLESQVHQLLAQYRVCKMRRGKLDQGGTEWFLAEQNGVVADVLKARALLTHTWDDLAWSP
jgi:hypothetical protein